MSAVAGGELSSDTGPELPVDTPGFQAAAGSILDSFTVVSPVREAGGEIVDFRHRYVNDAYCALVGFDRGQLVGRRLGELFPRFPGSRRFLAYRRVAEEGDPCRSDAVLDRVAWEGTRLATRVIDAVIAPLGEDLVVCARDVTDRKRAEERLASMGRLLERTQEISKTGGWQYDVASGRLTMTNEVYRIYGIEPPSRDPDVEEAIAAYDADSQPVIRAAFEQAVAAGEPYDHEVRLVRADGRRIWVRTIAEPVTEGGRVVRVHGNIADVSDRREVEEEIRTLNAELERRVAARTAELERVNRELETFAYSISHDLRAPLRAIDGFSTALLKDYASALDEQGRHYLDRVRAGAVRMAHLIDEILELSRLSRRPFECVPVDISASAREILAELRGGEPQRDVRAEVQGGLHAQADPTLVGIVLQNLLANAYKFTSKTPAAEIRVGAVDRDGIQVYFVADNGAGFDMARAEALFAPFQRLHRESEFPGDGIGLATVARAVGRHGGAIWADGAVDRGATFHFTLEPGIRPPTSGASER